MKNVVVIKIPKYSTPPCVQVLYTMCKTGLMAPGLVGFLPVCQDAGCSIARKDRSQLVGETL